MTISKSYAVPCSILRLLSVGTVSAAFMASSMAAAWANDTAPTQGGFASRYVQLADARTEAAKDFFSEAFTHYQEGDFDRAVEVFKMGLGIASDNALAHYYLAESLSELGRLGEAKFHYRKTASLSPDTKEGIKAAAKLQSKRIREAIESFRDCADCPKMAVIPAGSFMMGRSEGSQHRVTIPRAFAMGKYEVTFAEWDACARAGGCSHRPDDNSWGRGNRPVMRVSWDDANEYVRWLSRQTGQAYRLPSEAEWEYAARAGTTSRYHWGDSVGRGNANCDGCGSRWDNSRTAPVGSFSANRFGLYDMSGNVWEWVDDCWNDSYRGAPTNGRAWTSGLCSRRVLRGGSWFNLPRYLRAAFRFRYTTGYRINLIGFRIARTLP